MSENQEVVDVQQGELNATQTSLPQVEVDPNVLRVMQRIEEAFNDPSFDTTGVTYLDIVEGFATMLVTATGMFLDKNNYQVSDTDRQMIEDISLEIMNLLKQKGLNSNTAYTTFVLAGVLAAMSLGIKKHIKFIQDHAAEIPIAPEATVGTETTSVNE